MRLIIEDNENIPNKIQCNISIFNTGFLKDPWDKLGISHMTEHLLATSNETKDVVSKTFEDVLSIWAHTQDNNTEYGFTVSTYNGLDSFFFNLNEYLNSITRDDILDEIYDRELKVLCDEISEHDKESASNLLDTYVKHALYGSKVYYSNLLHHMQKTITKEDVLKFINERYINDNITIYLKGDKLSEKLDSTNKERLDEIIGMYEKRIANRSKEKVPQFTVDYSKLNSGIPIIYNESKNIIHEGTDNASVIFFIFDEKSEFIKSQKEITSKIALAFLRAIFFIHFNYIRNELKKYYYNCSVSRAYNDFSNMPYVRNMLSISVSDTDSHGLEAIKDEFIKSIHEYMKDESNFGKTKKEMIIHLFHNVTMDAQDKFSKEEYLEELKKFTYEDLSKFVENFKFINTITLNFI